METLEHPLEDAFRFAELLIHSGVMPTDTNGSISLDWSGEDKAHRMNRKWVQEQIDAHGFTLIEALRWMRNSQTPVPSEQVFRINWEDIRAGMLEDTYKVTGGQFDEYVIRHRPELETSRLEYLCLHPKRTMMTMHYRAACSGRLWSLGECLTTVAGHVRIFLPFETTRGTFARLDGQTITFGVGAMPFSLRL